MSIYDATEPHKITIPEPFSKLIISVPRAQFEKDFQNLNQLTATKISCRNQASYRRTLAQLCNDMHQMDKSTFLGYSQPMLEMIKESLIESGGQQRGISSLKALSLFRVQQYIQTHLENENLCAEDISQGVRLSSRYINELFQHQNTSLMRFLTEKRLERSQHYNASVEYRAYAERLQQDPQLWCKWSEKYINWRQLEILGLMSKGNWA